MSIYLKRKIDEYLINWKASKNKKPLIIKGARQVGKTESIRQFANNNYQNIIEINFASSPIYKQIVADGYEANLIIKNITRINPNFKFVPKKTLIFFDEIQAFPDITTSLKFFALDNNYDVICGGSLLGTFYNSISSISVGYKAEIELKSMDFEEFLWAKGYKEDFINQILTNMLDIKPFNDLEEKVLKNLFLDYCVVGGMPEVVKDYLTNDNFSNTLEIQHQIILGYNGDIRKYATSLDKAKIGEVFSSIPYQLAKENKKFQLKLINKNRKFKDYFGSIEWLSNAGIINVNYALNSLSLPLKGNIKEDCYIIYYADTGLLLSSLDEESQNDFRQNKNFNVYKGGFFESIIGEALVKQGYELHYYKKENSTLEEEFIIRYKDFIVPVEVKVSNNQSKSLNTLIKDDKHSEIKFGVKFIDGNIGFKNNIFTLPHYTAFLLKKFFEKVDIEKFIS